ncbi:MAG: anti-sigma factor antagonist [Firmicutes bacterium]|nr:anti-sigma factor antagonist [Bacillota bacterium]
MGNGGTDNPLVIALSGKIDSGNSAQIEETIKARRNGCDTAAVVLDMDKLEYISSAGLRVLLRLKKDSKDLRIINVNPEVFEIFEMTGFTEIMKVEKAYRTVSVDGCEVIGEGANGKIYRIDRDTVVKVYKNADALSDIQHEREVARLALILGVPTAISYDVVRVGDSYGSVFELLDAHSFSKILAEEPDRFEWCVKEYADMLKKVHSIHVPEGKLPSIKAKMLRAFGRMKDTLPDGLGDKLMRMTEAIPDTDGMIHGDYHTKNIVLSDGEVLLIDMDTLSVGHPIFELAQMYNSYKGFSEYDPEIVRQFQGFAPAIARRFWTESLKAYIGTDDESIITDIEDKVRCVAYARLIDWKMRHSDLDTDYDIATIDLWKTELTGLLRRLDTLSFDAAADAQDASNELELEASIDNLHRVFSFVDEHLETMGFSPKAQMQIDVAVEEIFTNIALYAYAPGSGTAKVRFEKEADPPAAVITFLDRGVPYDPLERSDPDIALSADDREIGGLGIFMAKKLMDDVSYDYKDGQNILTLKKNL